MEKKTEIYAEHVQPMIERLTRICEAYGLPMLVAVCLENKEVGDDKMEMTIAGSSNLDQEIMPPEPMVLAATLIRIPGFKIVPVQYEEVY
ncbi:MAG: hypothetical protein V4621_07595 [Pseudomonadota bacterium]